MSDPRYQGDPRLQPSKTPFVVDYEDTTHTYKVNEIVVPSVTQIIDQYFGDPGKGFYDEASAERGRFVHEITRAIDADASFIPSIPGFEGYVDAYHLFLEEHNVSWWESEQIVFNAELWYAGRLDRFGEIDEDEGVLDIKTGPRLPKASLQLGAYALPRHMEDLKGWVLELKKNGKYTLSPPIDLLPHMEAFHHLAAYHKYRMKWDKTVGRA